MGSAARRQTRSRRQTRHTGRLAQACSLRPCASDGGSPHSPLHPLLSSPSRTHNAGERWSGGVQLVIQLVAETPENDEVPLQTFSWDSPKRRLPVSAPAVHGLNGVLNPDAQKCRHRRCSLVCAIGTEFASHISVFDASVRRRCRLAVAPHPPCTPAFLVKILTKARLSDVHT